MFIPEFFKVAQYAAKRFKEKYCEPDDNEGTELSETSIV